MKFIIADEIHLRGSRAGHLVPDRIHAHRRWLGRSLALCLAALCVAMTVSVQAQQPTTKTPPVGVPKEARLFDGKWYFVYLEARAWKSARDKCSQLGGRLALVPDGPTHAFIRSLSKDLQLWLGATDEKVEGRWIWLDGKEMSFKAWDRYQPDNRGGKEHYLQTWTGGAWNDAVENEKRIVGFICEWQDK